MLVHDAEDEEDLIQLLGAKVGKTYKDVTINPDLPSDQRAELIKLLKQYAHIFSNKPGVTDLVEHEVRITTEEPLCA